MARTSASLGPSTSSGAGRVSFAIHIHPLIPGSFKPKRCARPNGTFRLIIDLMMATVISVLRSCFEAFSDRERVLNNAIFRIIGVFGRRIFARLVGVRSILWEIGGVDCSKIATKESMATGG